MSVTHLTENNFGTYVIDDAAPSAVKCWSSEKVAQEVAGAAGGAVIDDAVTTTTKTWSSAKISAEVGGKAAAAHNHDERYYTEAEVDARLSAKADSSHSHDELYYTEAEVDAIAAGKAQLAHTHPWNEVTKAGSKLSDIGDVPAYVEDRFLKITGGAPVWATTPGGGGTSTFPVQSLGSLTVATSVNWATGSYAIATLGANVDFTFASLGAEAEIVFLEVAQDAVGTRLVSFSGVNINISLTPVNQAAPSAIDIYTFLWNGSEFRLINFVNV